MADYTFDPATGQYIDEDGHALDREALIALSLVQIGDTDAEIADATQAYIDGKLTRDKWQEKVKDAILAGFVLQFLLGRGGIEQMAEGDWDELGDLVQAQYDFLDGFAEDLDAEALSDDQTAARAGMYASATYSALWAGMTTLMVAAEFTEERWIMTPAEHCEDCPELEAMGWVPLGTLPNPGDGSTACRANCKCYKEFRLAE